MWSPLRWCDKMDPESASNCYFMHPFCGHSIHRHCSLRYLPCAVILSPISLRSLPAAVMICVARRPPCVPLLSVTFGCPRFAFEFRFSMEVRYAMTLWVGMRRVFFLYRIATMDQKFCMMDINSNGLTRHKIVAHFREIIGSSYPSPMFFSMDELLYRIRWDNMPFFKFSLFSMIKRQAFVRHSKCNSNQTIFA